MLLIDALHINNGGGKILLDYLISENNVKSKSSVHYLLDHRIKNNHTKITNGTYEYLKSGLFERLLFYIRRVSEFDVVFSFANIPPLFKLNIPVYTYFHQPLFLEIEDELPLKQRFLLWLKTKIILFSIDNTSKWIVQSQLIKDKLSDKYGILKNQILIIPFYPPLPKLDIFIKRELVFLYVSNGESHKNHNRLLDAFVLFFDKMKMSELHLTIDKSYTTLIDKISLLQDKGYPIVNHGFLTHSELSYLYSSSKFMIFPSLAESFGMGIVEALENGCKIIGANRPYMFAICNPSITFNPESVEDICKSMINAIQGDNSISEQLVFNKIEELLLILNNLNNE